MSFWITTLASGSSKNELQQAVGGEMAGKISALRIYVALIYLFIYVCVVGAFLVPVLLSRPSVNTALWTECSMLCRITIYRQLYVPSTQRFRRATSRTC